MKDLQLAVLVLLSAVMIGLMYGLRKDVKDLAVQVDGLTARVDNLAVRVDGLTVRVDNLTIRLDNLTSSIGLLTSSVDGLLISTLTPSAAQATLACAQVSVYILFIFRHSWNSTLGVTEVKLRTCSAFAYRELEGKGILAVSASHCFINATSNDFDATRLALARDSRVGCTLLQSFTSDSSILFCKDSPPALKRSATVAVFAQAVVSAGYFEDNTGIPTQLSVHNNFSMHVLSSTIAVSIGSRRELVAAASDGPTLSTSLPFGFLQGQVLQGMSGGPVLNSQCGVLGVISRFTTNSAFASLDDVDGWLLGEGKGWMVV